MADAVKLLAEHGVEITENELREVFAEMAKAVRPAGSELSEEQLEQVAGGFQDAAVPPALLADIAARMVAGFSERETGTTTIYTT